MATPQSISMMFHTQVLTRVSLVLLIALIGISYGYEQLIYDSSVSPLFFFRHQVMQLQLSAVVDGSFMHLLSEVSETTIDLVAFITIGSVLLIVIV